MTLPTDIHTGDKNHLSHHDRIHGYAAFLDNANAFTGPRNSFTGDVQFGSGRPWVDVTHPDFGADPTGVADSTGAIQAAFDSEHTVLIPSGAYRVDTVIQRVDYQQIWFLGSKDGGAVLLANSLAPQAAVLQITSRYAQIYNPRVSCEWKSNYKAAYKLYSPDGTHIPANCLIFNPDAQNCLIGFQVGADAGGTLNGRAISENVVYNYSTRGCERAIFVNETNAFVGFIGGPIGVQKNEWDAENPGVYDFARSYVARVDAGVLWFNGCEFFKNTTDLGFGFHVKDLMYVDGCVAELSCPHYLSYGASELFVDGYRQNFYSNANDNGSIFTFDGSATTPHIEGSGIYLKKSVGAVGGRNGLIDVNSILGGRARFANVRFANQNLGWLIRSDLIDGDVGAWWDGDIRIVNSMLSDNAQEQSFSMADHTLASGYQRTDIARWDVTSGAGCSATMVAEGQPTFTNALLLDATGAGKDVSAGTQRNVDHSIKAEPRALTVEMAMKAEAVGPAVFNGTLQAVFWDNAGNFLGATQLGKSATGEVAHLAAVSGIQGYQTVRTTVYAPANCAEVTLVFRAGQTTQACKWWIGAIKIW